MRIALIGDVHANLHALEAVLEHARGQGVAAYWNIGDFVGYGAFPGEVVRRLRALEAVSIVGNYDLKVLKVKKKRKKWRKTKRPEKLLAFQWAYDHLPRAERKYLRSLPKERRMEWAGRRVLLTHGSPVSNEEHLTPSTPASRLRELAEGVSADLIVCGHSHRAFVREVDGVCYVNTGSVGRPDDGDPRACYAVLQLEAEALRVDHHRVAYDVDGAVAAIRAHGLPEAFAQMLLHGRDFDTMMESTRKDPGAF